MSTTIKYKNNVLATLENESISLKTANKFAEADVEINAVGGNPDGKVYQDQYKYVVLKDDEDEDVETKIRYVKQNGLIEANSGEAFNWVDVDIDQVRDLLEDSFYDVTDADLNGLETIGAYAFYGRTNLIGISSKTIKTIGANAFQTSSIVKVDLPNAINISGNAFQKCQNLITITLPSLKTYINKSVGGVFNSCYNLQVADVGELDNLRGNNNFAYCYVIDAVILRKSDAVVPAGSNPFMDTPFAGRNGTYSGHIYVPSALLTAYQEATGWSTLYANYSDLFVSIEGSEYEYYYADGTGVLQPITQNLTNCTIDNDLAHYHTKFVTQIVPDDGYTKITSVSVSMDGVNITSSAYDTASHTITIDSPDGEIVITATGGV